MSAGAAGERDYVTEACEHPQGWGVVCKGPVGLGWVGPGAHGDPKRGCQAVRPTARPSRCTPWWEFSCVRASGDLVSERSPPSPGLPFGTRDSGGTCVRHGSSSHSVSQVPASRIGCALRTG